MQAAGLPALQSGEPGQVRKEAATAGLCKCRGSGSPLIYLPMSYQVLARKWRPRDFGGLVGQEHVVRALRHALEQKRLHHAYLFAGTRGVGKTTLARILAKCLNCETGVTPQPCGKCAACLEIDAGRFVDLLETAQYVPSRGRYKVYVIDEVHMLSTSAFNAMLKTLEEPPEHLKFILATTDPQKIPVTVLSRCLQFNLKQMPPAAIATHLSRVLESEKVEFDREALALISRAAAGSMRDAHAGFVMTLLRMLAFRPEGASRDRIILEKTKASTPSADKSWPELARQLPVTGAARELARNAELRRREGGLFELAVPKEKAYLADRNYQDKLQAALEQHLGSGVTVKVAVGETSGASPAAIENGEREARRAEAARAVRSDGFVQDLVDLFDGKVVDSTIGSNEGSNEGSKERRPRK